MKHARVHRTPRAIWRWPIALGLLTAIGLVSALVGDGGWDTLSWIALGAPLIVTVVALARRTTPD